MYEAPEILGLNRFTPNLKCVWKWCAEKSVQFGSWADFRAQKLATFDCDAVDKNIKDTIFNVSCLVSLLLELSNS